MSKEKGVEMPNNQPATIYQKEPPTKMRGKKEIFRKAKNDPFWHLVADMFFFTMIENRFHSLKIKNQENFEKRNKNYATIVYAPHSNWWDGILAYNISRRVFKHKMNLMIEELNRFPILSLVGGYSVNKISAQESMKSLKYSVEILKNPKMIVWIFPQGIIKPPNSRPFEFQTGLAYIVQNAIKQYGGVNLVPLAIDYTFLREDKPEIIADVGEPIFIDSPIEDRHNFTKSIEDNFTQLCDNQLSNIKMGLVDDYTYIFRQRLPWYKKFEKWLKRV